MRRFALALLSLSLFSCHGLGPYPAPPRIAEHSLEELPPETYPLFADDLDYSGLDEALSRSLDYYARAIAADPGRTLSFGACASRWHRCRPPCCVSGSWLEPDRDRWS